MKRFMIVIIMIITTNLGGCSWGADQSYVTISAAASLHDVLKEAVDTGNTELDIPARIHTAGSQMVARQVAEGQPADIVFLANERWMDYLETRGKIEAESRINLLSNQIVLIRKRNQTIEHSDDLRQYQRKLALGNPEAVPAGIYARKTLESMGIWKGIKDQVVSFPHVRATLGAVASGNIPLGIVYETDARRMEIIEIIDRLPIKYTPNILYPIALVKNHSPQAKQWFEYLKNSPEIYKKHGFRYLLR